MPEGRFKISAIKGIAIHHSVTSEPAPSSVEWELAHLRAIDAFHVAKDYGGIGYHVCAFPSGRVYQVGDFDGARAHVASRNHELVGICAIGDFSSSLPGVTQMGAIVAGIRAVLDFYRLPLPILGHNQWALPGQGTVCAGTLNGYDWTPWLLPPVPEPVDNPTEDELRLGVIRTVANGKYRPEYFGVNDLGEYMVELRNEDGTPAQPPIILAVPRR